MLSDFDFDLFPQEQTNARYNFIPIQTREQEVLSSRTWVNRMPLRLQGQEAL
jgi:hypothetical protein